MLFLYILDISLDHGRGDGGEGEAETQSGLSDAAHERQETDEQSAELLRDLPAPGETPGRG